MKSSELGKANGDYQEWGPEVGQECEFDIYNDGEYKKFYVAGRMIDGRLIIQLNENCVDYISEDTPARPLTKTDRYRDEQIQKLTSILSKDWGNTDIEHNTFKQQATALIEQGARILADNEFISRELTDEQWGEVYHSVSNKYQMVSFNLIREIAKAVQNAINGEA